jgi:hypothetical protein
MIFQLESYGLFPNPFAGIVVPHVSTLRELPVMELSPTDEFGIFHGVYLLTHPVKSAVSIDPRAL